MGGEEEAWIRRLSDPQLCASSEPEPVGLSGRIFESRERVGLFLDQSAALGGWSGMKPARCGVEAGKWPKGTTYADADRRARVWRCCDPGDARPRRHGRANLVFFPSRPLVILFAQIACQDADSVRASSNRLVVHAWWPRRPKGQAPCWVEVGSGPSVCRGRERWMSRCRRRP